MLQKSNKRVTISGVTKRLQFDYNLVTKVYKVVTRRKPAACTSSRAGGRPNLIKIRFCLIIMRLKKAKKISPKPKGEALMKRVRYLQVRCTLLCLVQPRGSFGPNLYTAPHWPRGVRRPPLPASQVAPSFTSRLRVLSGLTSLTWASGSAVALPPLLCLYYSTELALCQDLF